MPFTFFFLNFHANDYFYNFDIWVLSIAHQFLDKQIVADFLKAFEVFMSNNNNDNTGAYHFGWCYLGFILPCMSMNWESLPLSLVCGLNGALRCYTQILDSLG